jgi:hypothetical protein
MFNFAHARDRNTVMHDDLLRILIASHPAAIDISESTATTSHESCSTQEKEFDLSEIDRWSNAQRNAMHTPESGAQRRAHGILGLVAMAKWGQYARRLTPPLRMHREGVVGVIAAVVFTRCSHACDGLSPPTRPGQQPLD